VSGHPWQTESIQNVGLKSLVAKVLCAKHNRSLSEVDSAGKRFCHQLVYAANSLINPRERGTEYAGSENGTLLERWLLKYICGCWAAGDFNKLLESQESVRPESEWVNAVFGNSVLEKPRGLWLGGSDRRQFAFTYPLTMEMTFHLDSGHLLGAVFQINGIELILNLTNLQAHLPGIVPEKATYHPSSLMIVGRTQTGEGGMHHMTFDWNGRSFGKHIWIVHTRKF